MFLGVTCSDCSAYEFFRWALYSDDPIDLAQPCDEAAALAMQLWRGIAQLAHFSGGQNAAREAWSRGEQFRERV